ncbi:hypothetical protein NFI96_004344 [Prochilodus magdalenae]|nr:hypothetical protein NFI96_004344 [Prochilodus magdalenae]
MQAPCDVIHSTVAALQTQHPDAFYVISGDWGNQTTNWFDGPAPAAPSSYPPAAFTTITLTFTISVTITLTSTISTVNLHGRPSQETAEGTTPQEGGQPGQSVPQIA